MKTWRVTAVMTALMFSACSTESKQAPAVAPEHSSQAAEQVSDVLGEIVISETSAPEGTEYLQGFDGTFSGTQMVQDAPADVQTILLERWVDALTREFASPETAEVILGGAPAGQLDPADHHFVGSIASAYEDAGSAQRAIKTVLRTMSERAQATEDLTLGDGGAVLRDRFLQVASVSYVWTHDRYLLVLTANGMHEDMIRDIAEDMDGRAP